ncbi:MAG: valine--tRNA ligase [Clostridiales bacterium]|nr:valine--tRNA ligase [Clostridiales bacterium]
MDKVFNPKAYENKLYQMWLNKGYFTAHVDKTKTPFTIVMPPPNITGQLHMGHALNNTIQDVIIRFKRMQGFETLWLPGTDHASIATELKVAEQLKKEGIDKQDISREDFLKRAWQWKEQYGNRINEQLKKLGSSCDWSREAFTMDENLSRAVKDSFVKYYNGGLIYRGKRIINWCTSCRTALSDAEVEYTETPSYLWHIRYPLSDGSGFVTVATTRPETMLGDTAVAVNPNDLRYADLVGKTLVLPLTGRDIVIVADDYVEKDFGSGAVKITPAHDPNDFEVGLRHSLEVIKVIGDDGIMNENAGAYAGQDRFTCRKNLIAELSAQGFLVKTEPYTHNVGECYRCHTVVEPLISKQWFLKMKPLTGPAIKYVKNKKIEYIPIKYEKTYLNWMYNLKDWCISRQLIWGHRIPAYYCGECGHMAVEYAAPTKCAACGSAKISQDEDVLDTWFSSALWPFSTLGYPEKTEDLDYFYPTSVLVTAYDIIPFWVARMIFSGLHFMKDVPFSEVLIHGIVRDSEGKKMSKSLGNGIDPLELIDLYGADALRFSLSTGIAPGSDTRFMSEKIENARNFMNKVWNASRFVILNSENQSIPKMYTFRLNDADKWILTKLNKTIRAVTKSLTKYDIGLASAKLYEFVWDDFCDWYIELCKPALYSENAEKRGECLSVLNYTLVNILKLLHPFTPFITEEIYGAIADKNVKASESIMISEWPEPVKKFTAVKKENDFQNIMDIIKGIRNIRAEMNVLPSKKIKLYMIAKNERYILKNLAYIKKLCNAEEVVFIADKTAVTEKTAAAVFDFGEVLIPLGELLDVNSEIERLEREAEKVEKEIVRGNGMLSNTKYTEKAPKDLVDREREKLESNLELKKRLIERIEYLKGN